LGLFTKSPFFPNPEQGAGVFNSSVSPSINELNKQFSNGISATQVLATFISSSDEVSLDLIGNFGFSDKNKNIFLKDSKTFFADPNKKASLSVKTEFTLDRSSFIKDTFFKTLSGGNASNINAVSRVGFGKLKKPFTLNSGVTLAPLGEDAFGLTLNFNFNFKDAPNDGGDTVR